MKLQIKSEIVIILTYYIYQHIYLIFGKEDNTVQTLIKINKYYFKKKNLPYNRNCKTHQQNK